MSSLIPEFSLAESRPIVSRLIGRPTLGRRLWLAWRRQPLALRVSLVPLSLLLFVVAFANVLAPHDPIRINMAAALRPPGPQSLMGTDNLGRDVWSRVLFGARVSALVGVAAILPATLLGIAVGVTAGYFGGWADEILMRVTDIFLAFPLLVLAMGISVALGRGLTNAVAAMIITIWPTYARLVRSQALSIRSRDYIGMNDGWIILRHVVPNCIDSTLAQASMDVGTVIIIIASLSFLGLGAQPPVPEWGLMILEGRLYLREAWWMSTFPGAAIFITAWTFTLLGDGLRDRLDR